MIDPSVLLTLKKRNELRVAVFLSESTEPMRLKDFVESPLKITKARCLESLNGLIEKGVVIRFTKFGAILYEVPAGIKTEPTGIETIPGGIKTEPAGIETIPGGIKTEPQSRRKSSRNKLNKDSSSQINEIKEIKGISNLEIPQAENSLNGRDGKSGSAVGQSPASAPADPSEHRRTDPPHAADVGDETENPIQTAQPSHSPQERNVGNGRITTGWHMSDGAKAAARNAREQATPPCRATFVP
jgi:hypothetical protein